MEGEAHQIKVTAVDDKSSLVAMKVSWKVRDTAYIFKSGEILMCPKRKHQAPGRVPKCLFGVVLFTIPWFQVSLFLLLVGPLGLRLTSMWLVMAARVG